MKRFFWILIAVFVFATPAVAQKATPAQLGELKKLVDSGAVTGAEIEAFLGQNRPPANPQPEGCARVEVDYGLAPAEMAKGYDWTSDYIEDGSFQANPRGKGKVSKEACWFKFDSGVSSEEAQKRIEAGGGFLVADLWELNALGAAKPDLQREFWIVGLGSRWSNPDGNVPFPILYRDGSRRDLNLSWCDPGERWLSDSRFLAVRK